MTKDGVLLTLHDDNLSRTTDIETKFPGRESESSNMFTFEELLTLDASSVSGIEVKLKSELERLG